MAKEAISPLHVGPPVGQYSHGIKVRGSALLFIAGQVALDEHGQLVGHDDIERQTRQVLSNVRKIVEAAGGMMGDIVQVTIYHTNLDRHHETARRVRNEYFTPPYPAGTLVEVARLADPAYLIEMDAIAALE